MTSTRFALLASAALALLVVLLDHRSIVGALVVLAFLSLAPGYALSRLVRLPADVVTALVIAIGASFSVDVLVTETMVYARVWTAARAVVALCILVAGLVVAEYLRAVRDEPNATKGTKKGRGP